MGNPNKATYSAADIVNYYARLDWLQPAEAAILERLQPQLSNMKMLDMGVGGGRTTLHFAPLVETYTGIDYSPKMIAACQDRFKSAEYSPSFKVCDGRNMSQFETHSFDFILFSYNGIDYVSHGDRLKILSEIKRVGKPNGYFVFSSHNLQALEQELSWRKHLSRNPLNTYASFVALSLFWLFNPSLNRQSIVNADYLIVRDDSHLFRLKTYYIRAAQQLKQLSQHFSPLEVYPWRSQTGVLDPNDSSMEANLWLYYLCQIKADAEL